MRNTPAWDSRLRISYRNLCPLKKDTHNQPDSCPHCGAEVPAGAAACPECGSDEQTGWSPEADDGGLDLPDHEFDYDEYVKREFGTRSPVPHGVHWFWWLVALIVTATVLYLWLRFA